MQATRRGILAGGLSLLAAGPALAAPEARLIDERWTRFGEGGDPDQTPWARFLDAHLRTGAKSGVHLVDYDAGRADRDALRAHVEALAAVRPTELSRPAAMAYWINLYNILTVDVVLEAWPVESIREIGGFLGFGGPWGRKLVRVEGQDLSLDDIEHGILRPVWRDPRIHYGVNCASIGCPNLAAEPYVAESLDAMLDTGAQAYAGHPRGADPGPDGLVVSSIYRWFEEDFGGTEEGVLAHLLLHAPYARRSAIASAGRISGHRYDWTVNAV